MSRLPRHFPVSSFGVLLGLVLTLISPAATAQLFPTGEVVVSTSVRDPNPGLAPLKDGGTVVTWVDQVVQENESVEILRGRWLDPFLSTRFEIDLVEAHGSDLAQLHCPQVTRIGLGRVVFTWLEVTPGVRRVAYRVVGAEGTPLTEILYPYPPRAGQDDECPRIRGRDLGFVIAWSSRTLGVRKFSNDGVPTSPPFELGLPAELAAAPAPALAIDRDGGFAAAWVGRPTPTSRPTLLMRRFARDGTALGRAIPITSSEVLRFELVESAQGFELIWNRRLTSGRTTIRVQAFFRDLSPRNPARTALVSDFAVLSRATVRHPALETILTYFENGQVRGLPLTRKQLPCGPSSRLNAGRPLGAFPVTTSGFNILIAGVESPANGGPSELLVRSYSFPNCALFP